MAGWHLSPSPLGSRLRLPSPALLPRSSQQADSAGISLTFSNSPPLFPALLIVDLVNSRKTSVLFLPLSLALHFFVPFLGPKKKKKKRRKIIVQEHQHQAREELSIFQKMRQDEKSMLPNCQCPRMHQLWEPLRNHHRDLPLPLQPCSLPARMCNAS